jgi:hypothetical protein
MIRESGDLSRRARDGGANGLFLSRASPLISGAFPCRFPHLLPMVYLFL